jgi:hypothetical protein
MKTRVLTYVSWLDFQQLLVKSTLSPELKQVLTFGEKDIKRQWDY